MNRILLVFLLLATAAIADAQVKIPQASPAATVKQNIGLSSVTVDYSRPSAKNRKIFGDVVPFDKLWRTGANASTDIIFASDATFGGVAVAAGKYALYTVPSKQSWDVILYKDSEQWGAPTELKSDLIAARVQAKPEATSTFAESFTIGFQDLRSDRANLTLNWENTLVIVAIVMDASKEIVNSITSTLNSGNAKASDYFQAASYYLENVRDSKKALEYVQKANQLQPETFYMLKLQAEIEAANGMKKQAISTANRSMELAQKANNADYVKMNADNIAKWSK